MIHAFISVLFCCSMLIFHRPPWIMLWPAVFYISREFAQAEYRYVLTYCDGSFLQMPTFAGFYPEIWNIKSLLDWILPLIVSLSFYYYLRNYGYKK